MAETPNYPPQTLDEIKKLAQEAIEEAVRPPKRPPRPVFIGLVMRPPKNSPEGASPEYELVNQLDLIVPPEEEQR